MADITLKNVRLSFPDLFVAKEFKAGDNKPRFNATFLIPRGSENDKAIQAAIRAAAEETYGAKAAAYLESFRGNANKFCYLNGDLKEYEGYAGMNYLACHAQQRPLVIDRNRSPLTAEDGKPYAGCYVIAKVSIYAQKGEFPGIRASFSGVQFCADGDAFSAGSPASVEDFEDLGGAAEGGSDPIDTGGLV